MAEAFAVECDSGGCACRNLAQKERNLPSVAPGPRRAHSEIGVAVAVCVAQPGQAAAEGVPGRAAGQGQIGGCIQGRPAQEEVGPPCAAVAVRRADEKISVAVAVHIPGHRQRLAHPFAKNAGESQVSYPIRRRPAQIEIDLPAARTGPRRAYEEIGVAVAVHISAPGKRSAEGISARRTGEGQRGG